MADEPPYSDEIRIPISFTLPWSGRLTPNGHFWPLDTKGREWPSDNRGDPEFPIYMLPKGFAPGTSDIYEPGDGRTLAEQFAAMDAAMFEEGRLAGGRARRAAAYGARLASQSPIQLVADDGRTDSGELRATAQAPAGATELGPAAVLVKSIGLPVHPHSDGNVQLVAGPDSEEGPENGGVLTPGGLRLLRRLQQQADPTFGGAPNSSTLEQARTGLATQLQMRERQLELGLDPATGRVRPLEGAGGVHIEQELGRSIVRSTEPGADFVDRSLGSISLKGPIPPSGSAEGLAQAAISDTFKNTLTKALFVDLTGLSAEDAKMVENLINAGKAPNSKPIFFLR